MSKPEDRRRYIRHPVSVPLAVEVQNELYEGTAQDISQGGLLFCYPTPLENGTKLLISLPNPEEPGKPLSFSGTVVRSEFNSIANQYDIGIAFFSPGDAQKVRMLEQILLIEAYRKHAHIDDFNRAALEWIEKYSENFPVI